MPQRAYSDSQPDERCALRLMLLDLKLEVVGEAADWPTTLALFPGNLLGYAAGGLGLCSCPSGSAVAG